MAKLLAYWARYFIVFCPSLHWVQIPRVHPFGVSKAGTGWVLGLVYLIWHLLQNFWLSTKIQNYYYFINYQLQLHVPELVAALHFINGGLDFSVIFLIEACHSESLASLNLPVTGVEYVECDWLNAVLVLLTCPCSSICMVGSPSSDQQFPCIPHECWPHPMTSHG